MPRHLTITTHSEAETRRCAALLADAVGPGDVIALDGELGAGKTCFVRGLAEGLGIDPLEVSSPTFVICHEYGLDRAVPLVHFDAYRVVDVEDLQTVGFDEVLAAGDSVVAIEWAERIRDALPGPDRLTRVMLRHAGESRRDLLVQSRPDVLERVAVLRDEGVGSIATAPACPICGDPVERGYESFPFCSARCRTVDLGRWLGGVYRIARPAGGEPDQD